MKVLLSRISSLVFKIERLRTKKLKTAGSLLFLFCLIWLKDTIYVGKHSNPLKNLKIGRQTRIGHKATSPVVIEKYKLIFFPIPKVGCTSFLMLARRMAGFSNYNQLFSNKSSLLHDKTSSGLKYMFDYSPKKQTEFLTSKEWVKAVFIRDPKERFLSAWLNKVVRYPYASEKCCPIETRNLCNDYTKKSLLNFYHLANECDDLHWRPQTMIIGRKYLPYINFVGRLENVEKDAERLLKRVGAWECCGKQGWGLYGNTSFAQSKMKGQHASTKASQKLKKYFTSHIKKKVEDMYHLDYSNKYFR